MAEALFKQHLREDGQDDGWRVESAGVWASDGVPATENARTVMAERGLDLQAHRSRVVSARMLSEFGLILTMEARHRRFIKDVFPQHAAKVYLLSEMVDVEADVEDPVIGSLDDYRLTADHLVDLLKRGYNKILALVGGS
jgi:protein-tyrosine-phosphatase